MPMFYNVQYYLLSYLFGLTEHAFHYFLPIPCMVHLSSFFLHNFCYAARLEQWFLCYSICSTITKAFDLLFPFICICCVYHGF
jgi:hypothetical protein